MKIISSLNGWLVYGLNDATQEQVIFRNKKHKSKPIKDTNQQFNVISDFSMPNCCSKIQQTNDKQHIFLLGSYPYQLKCFEYMNMSEKFLRGIDMHCEKFQIISDDDSKFCVLKGDRNLEFHTGRGVYYNITLPSFINDLNVDFQTATLYLPSRNQIYALNLEFGKFQEGMYDTSSEFTMGDFNNFHSLYSIGKLDGSMSFYDPRAPKLIGSLNCVSNTNKMFNCTSVKFKSDMILGVGLSSGEINIFDIRSKKPLIVKDHYFRFPITKLMFSDNDYQENVVLSADKKNIKVWDIKNGNSFTNIDPNSQINDFTIINDSGLIMIACEETCVRNYFMPSLGPAPSWCNFLDEIINGAEKDPLPMNEFGHHKFIDMKEIESLGIRNLIGTGTLTAYMHGYLIPKDVYERMVLQKSEENDQYNIQTLEKYYHTKAQSLVDEVIGGKFKELLQKQSENKSNHNFSPEVNSEFFKKIMESKTSSLSHKISKDERFKDLFKDKDFEIEHDSENYIMNKAITDVFKQTTVNSSINENSKSSHILEKDSSDEEFNEATKKMTKDLHDFRYSKHLNRKKKDREANIDIDLSKYHIKETNLQSADSNIQFNKVANESKAKKLSTLIKNNIESSKNSLSISSKPNIQSLKTKKQVILERHMAERKQNVRQIKIHPNSRKK